MRCTKPTSHESQRCWSPDVLDAPDRVADGSDASDEAAWSAVAHHSQPTQAQLGQCCAVNCRSHLCVRELCEEVLCGEVWMLYEVCHV